MEWKINVRTFKWNEEVEVNNQSWSYISLHKSKMTWLSRTQITLNLIYNTLKCENANSYLSACQSTSTQNKYLPSWDGSLMTRGLWLRTLLPKHCTLSTWKLMENCNWYPKYLGPHSVQTCKKGVYNLSLNLELCKRALIEKSVPAPLDMYPRPWGQSFLKATVPGKGQTSQFCPQPRPPSQQHSDLVTEFLLLDPIWHILCKTSVKQ